MSRGNNRWRAGEKESREGYTRSNSICRGCPNWPGRTPSNIDTRKYAQSVHMDAWTLLSPTTVPVKLMDMIYPVITHPPEGVQSQQTASSTRLKYSLRYFPAAAYPYYGAVPVLTSNTQQASWRRRHNYPTPRPSVRAILDVALVESHASSPMNPCVERSSPR